MQGTFGITKSELLFVFLLLLGLIIGTFVQYFTEDKSKLSNPAKKEIIRILDSLALAERTTYIGTDLRDSSYPELMKGDTIIKKEQPYPAAIKKDDTLAEKININTASLTELMKLPGIGKKTAEKIIEFRRNYPFRKSSDLMNVTTIGEKKFEKIKPNVVVK